MKRNLLIALLFAAGVRFAVAGPEGWSTNLTAALAEAAARQRPVLVYFTASWCGPCKLLARTTLADEMVVTALTNLPHLVLDIDEFPRLAEKHDVKAVPTFAMLAPNGTAVARATGYRAAGPFLEWLTNSTTEVAAAVARQKQMEERFVALDRLLAAPDPETARKTARELFDLCAEKDDGVRKAATTSLQRLAGRDAVLLLDGLNHPRLATRIEVANLLRARLGETFAVDPWGDSLAREKGIAHWREKLALKPDLEKSP